MEDHIKTPNISVMMCVFNAQDYLREAIDGILEQSYRDFEFIIINDGSTDKSLEIIKSYNDTRIKLYSNKNMGIVAARNKAISKARGRYLAWQDADDISLRNRLEQQYRYLEENPDVGILGSNYEIIDTKGGVIDTTDVFTDSKDLKLALMLFNDIGQGTVMLKRSIADSIRYDNAFKLGEDYDFWTRSTHVTKVMNMKTNLYQWRFHESSSWTGNIKEMQKFAYKIRDREFNYYFNHTDEYNPFSFHPLSTRQGYRKYCQKKGRVYRDLAILYAKRGYLRRAVLLLILGIIVNPGNPRNFRFLNHLIFRKSPDTLEYEGI